MLLICRALFLVVILKHFIKPALGETIEHSVDAMEQVKFGYSMKNIPIPTQQEYRIELYFVTAEECGSRHTKKICSVNICLESDLLFSI